VLLRAINPADPAFGRLPDAVEVEKALKSAKAPLKKKSVKKSSGGGSSNKAN
jgi:hypothetical protein